MHTHSTVYIEAARHNFVKLYTFGLYSDYEKSHVFLNVVKLPISLLLLLRKLMKTGNPERLPSVNAVLRAGTKRKK